MAIESGPLIVTVPGLGSPALAVITTVQSIATAIMIASNFFIVFCSFSFILI